MRHVCGLDVHKDSVFVCILNEKGVVFQEKFGVLTPELERMVGVIMEHGVTEVGMESTSVILGAVYYLWFYEKYDARKKDDASDADGDK